MNRSQTISNIRLLKNHITQNHKFELFRNPNSCIKNQTIEKLKQKLIEFLTKPSVDLLKFYIKGFYNIGYKSLQVQNKNTEMIEIATESEILNFFQEKYSKRKTKIWAFYNSQFNKVIFDEKYMLLPVDDRLSTRGHGTFDVVYVKEKNIINLDAHIDRLYASSQTVQITPPIQKQRAKQAVIGVMKSVFHKYIQDNGPQSEKQLNNQIFGIRMVVSSGYGDFGIASIDKKAVFYILVFEPYIKREVQEQGVKDYVVKYVKQLKNDLVHTKTTNYLQNAMMANASKKKGGYVGIKALQNGVLLEASIANIAFIFGKQFAAPRWQTVIKGTTLMKLMKYIEELKQQGLIEKISFRDIKIQQAQQADQMIIIGGDKIVPVLSLNDKVISVTGKGKFTAMFQKWYKNTNSQLTPVQL